MLVSRKKLKRERRGRGAQRLCTVKRATLAMRTGTGSNHNLYIEEFQAGAARRAATWCLCGNSASRELARWTLDQTTYLGSKEQRLGKTPTHRL